MEVLDENVVPDLRVHVNDDNKDLVNGATTLTASTQPSQARKARQPSFPKDPRNLTEFRAASASHEPHYIIPPEQPYPLNTTAAIAPRSGDADTFRAWCAIVVLALLVAYSTIPVSTLFGH